MKRSAALFVLLPMMFILGSVGAVRATNGLYPFAYGGKSAGMGGATLASGDDALNQAINPANLPDIPRRIDFDVMWIRANVNFRNSGPNQLINDPRLGDGSAFDPSTAAPTFYHNDKNAAVDPCCTTDNNFNIPVVGYVHPLNPAVSLGVAAYGLAGGGGRIKGIDGPLYQDSKYRAMMLIAAFGPSIGLKLGDSVNLGVSVVGLGGKFSIQQPAGFDPNTYALGSSSAVAGTPIGFGLGNFANFFNTVGAKEGVGYVKFKDDAGVSAKGVGFKVGLTLKPAKWLRISAAFTPRRSLRFSGTAHFDFDREMENAMDFMGLTPVCMSPGVGSASDNVCTKGRSAALKNTPTTGSNFLPYLVTDGTTTFLSNSSAAQIDDGTMTVVNETNNLKLFQNALTGCSNGFQDLSSCTASSLFRFNQFGLDPAAGWSVNYHTTASFVLPPQADLGIAIMPTDRLTVELDASYYWYKRSFRRFAFDLSQGDNPNINKIIGSDNFTYAFRTAWKDQVTYRAGLQYMLNNAWTVRAGYAYGSNPITSAGASILFPAYGFHTATVGGTVKFWDRYEITAALERAFERSLSTTSSNIECFQGTVPDPNNPCSGSNSTESHNQWTGHFQLSYIF